MRVVSASSFARTWFTVGERVVEWRCACPNPMGAPKKRFSSLVRVCVAPKRDRDPIFDPRQARSYHGEAADSFDLGGGAIQIRLTNGDEWVVATALLSPGIQQSGEVAARTIRNIS